MYGRYPKPTNNSYLGSERRAGLSYLGSEYDLRKVRGKKVHSFSSSEMVGKWRGGGRGWRAKMGLHIWAWVLQITEVNMERKEELLLCSLFWTLERDFFGYPRPCCLLLTWGMTQKRCNTVWSGRARLSLKFCFNYLTTDIKL